MDNQGLSPLGGLWVFITGIGALMKVRIVQKYLDVPYKDKEIAKERGARFDMSVKRWYVPEGVNTFLFKRWIPKGKSFEKRRKEAMGKFYDKKGAT